jgi:Fe-Mn family superoxide dismutase
MSWTRRRFLSLVSTLPILGLMRPSAALSKSLESSKSIFLSSSNGVSKMSFSLPELPYASNALEPHITANTLSFHHGKHHQAYVTNLNKLIEGTDLAGASLEDICKKTATDSSKAGIFNNAAQVWNHSFYWNSMKANGGGEANGALAEQIKKDFGSFSAFVEQFKTAATTQFGSGWAWLVWDGSALKISKTGNADTPIVY